MKNLEKVLNDNLHILCGDPDMKKVVPEGTISITYRRGKCLKERISPLLYPRTVTESTSRVTKCNKSRCDIRKNYMLFKNKFTCTVTGKTYKVRDDLTCKSDNVVYLMKSVSNSMLTLPLKRSLSLGLEFTKVILILAKTGVEWRSIS